MERNSNFGFDIFRKRVKLNGTLRLVSGLHIGIGRALGPTASDLPVLKDFDKAPFIPGSSFKGVLRSNIENWLRAFGECLACDPTDDDSKCINSTSKREIISYFSEDSDRHLLEQGCWACRLFGSPWVASKVHILDMKVKGHWRNEWLMVRDGVVIDRESGTAAPKGKYDFEAVPAGMEFQLEIIIENPEPYEMGLLAFGIDLFNQGFALLGGNTSRGLGRATINIEEIDELTADDLLAELRPPGATSEQEKDSIEQNGPAEPDIEKKLDELSQALIDCLSEAGSLDHDGLSKAMQEKGVTKKMLMDRGFVKKKSSPWKAFFADAVKKELIEKSPDGKFHLYGAEIVPDAETDQEEGEKSQTQEKENQEITRRMEKWKSELWKKLQPQERMKEKKHWEEFRIELEKRKQKKEGANV